jgi:hypothetical protein
MFAGGVKAADAQNQYSNQAEVQRTRDIRDTPLRDTKCQIARLSRKLKLTSDQKTGVKAILSDRDRQIGLIQESESLPDQSKGARIRSVVVNSNVLVENVLDSKQKQKFDEVLTRQSRRKDRNRQA